MRHHHYQTTLLKMKLDFHLWRVVVLGWSLSLYTTVVNGQTESTCLSNPTLNEYFVTANGGVAIPKEGSCCMKDVCNIPCPKTTPPPPIGYGIAVGAAIVIVFILGICTYVLVKGEAINYFVAGKTLPMWVVSMTLGGVAIDSNALLGNVDLSYKYSFWDGAVLPIGLCLSLILNSMTLGPKFNDEKNALTLPDVIGNRYGVLVEILCSLCGITSSLMLLAGNLVGMGVVTAYIWGTSQTFGIWIAGILNWSFTVAGGLFSIAYVDVGLGCLGWTGCIVTASWLIANYQSKAAPGPSIGFPGYIYPNKEVCDLYNGVPCSNDPSQCCYNEQLWCPSPPTNCTTDNGAYPIGDQSIYPGQMTDPYALSPFPNAMFWNWASIIILCFGNLAALDFQVRCIAAKDRSTAKWGCFIAGLFTLVVAVPFSFLGGITRYFYGPDSMYAEFEPDSCSSILGLPTCGAWVPDNQAFMKLLTFQTPSVLGAWCLIGIVAASMSASNGAILAMGTVFSHNILRQLDFKFPKLVTTNNLLLMARLSTVPFTIIATVIAASTGKTGYLLIVAFDVVLASVVPCLVAGFYLPNPSPRAALCSVLTGIILRITLEFTIPKDGSQILPYSGDEFLNYGTAASAKIPTFVDGGPDEVWYPSSEVCQQEQFKDYTGVDSLSAFLGSILVFLSVYFIERKLGRPLFYLPLMEPYQKNLTEGDGKVEETSNSVAEEGNEQDEIEEVPAQDDAQFS